MSERQPEPLRRNRIPVRFSVKTLLVLILFASISAALLTQIGISRARIEIKGTNLVSEYTGQINGVITWRFADPQQNTYRDIECEIRNLPRKDLLELKANDTYTFRYRAKPFGPFSRQPPASVFLKSCLNIPENQIVGFVTYKGWDKIVVDGTNGNESE